MKERNFENEPLVSVIVPVYNTEKYLRRCLDSIVWQSYKNIELICVNDASSDNCQSILEAYSDSDKRIKLVVHKNNMGLFKARISGVEIATGKYVMFVDSDDYISCDWIRLLVNKAEKENLDIVVGQWIYEYEDGKRYYLNMDPLHAPIKYNWDEVLTAYMAQQGTCFSWQLVWNKIYKMSLWKDSLCELKSFSDEHSGLTMCEDMAFSIALWSRAKSVANITSGALYYYYQHMGQSTNTQSNSKDNIIKKMSEALEVFNFIENRLKAIGKEERYKKDLYLWKLLYAKIYNNDLAGGSYEDKVRDCFGISNSDSLSDKCFPNFFFYTVKSEFNFAVFGWFEDIKRNIILDSTKVVSFDIFDTLLLRPFFYPTDIFYLLNDDIKEMADIKSYVDFAQIRIEAEKNCRERIRGLYHGYEDITLDEIYEQIKLDYSLPEKAVDIIKQKELEYEMRYCYVRETGKELLELARQQGKLVILTSDMYLPKDYVALLAEKNNLAFDRIYISSDIRLGKWSGNLYKFIIKDLNIKPESMLHIGDNWQSDIEAAKANNIRAYHLCKTTDMFRNSNPGIYAGNVFNEIFNNTDRLIDFKNAFNGYVGLRCALAVIANKLYDNPYVCIDNKSDYSAEPYRLGYGALGPYLFAVTKWLINCVKEGKYHTLHFVARDGYLPMLAYNIFKKYNSDLPDSHYLYVSRKSLVLADIYSEADLYSIINKLNIYNYSAKKLVKLFAPYFSVDKEMVVKAIGLPKAVYEKKFDDRRDYEKILKIIGKYLDKGKLLNNKENLKGYFAAQIKEHDAIFDIGYSGRAESSLSLLLGYPVDSFYIHTNSQIAAERMRNNGFSNKCFYDFKPKITGVIREHVFMKLAPSTVGYENLNGTLVPVFEDDKINAPTKLLTKIMQNAALEFVSDFNRIFHKDFDRILYRYHDMAATFEYYLHFSKEFDRKIFSCVEFEDDLGLGKKVNAFDFWNEDLSAANLNVIHADGYKVITKEIDRIHGFPKWKKALYYFFFDNKTFRKKLKMKLRKGH